MSEIIAVAVDGTPAGHGALLLAGKMALSFSASITVLCTIDAAYALRTWQGQISPGDQAEYPGAAQEQLAGEAIVSTAVAELTALGVIAEGKTLAGSPSRAIVGAAEALGATLIVMGHRHLSWLDRLLHPSICWDVLEHAHCPVLVSIADEHS